MLGFSASVATRAPDKSPNETTGILAGNTQESFGGTLLILSTIWPGISLTPACSHTDRARMPHRGRHWQRMVTCSLFVRGTVVARLLRGRGPPNHGDA
jgi:hypothetical protein